MTTKTKILSLLLTLVLAVCCFAVVSCGPDEVPDEGPTKTEWPEAGVYYFDDVNDENTLTLNVGDTFSLYVKGSHQSGTYTLTDTALVLDFTAEGVENVTATLEDNVITFTQNGASMRFLKKINYTVSFNVNGGTETAQQTVVNGKTVTKPADPTREGFVFVGWYADAEYKVPFAFGATPVSADTTVFARWSEKTATGVEHSVKLDANYADAGVLAELTTMGGKLFDLPTPEREGYTFGGWWVSQESNGEKLSYKYEEGALLDASTTLYALWVQTPAGTALPAPVVNVAAGTVSWDSISGARSYAIKVINESGEAIIDDTTAATTYNVPFGTYAAGKYEIRVTALANSGESDNSETVRYYVNKALTKVSQFTVIEPSMLVFNTVENAEKYIISVICGNPDHDHSAFDNGSSRTFNFANCPMTEDGIKFTVTAVAEGYASSTSDVFTYERKLDSVTGLRFDAASETLVWNEVANAECYMVSVKCGNEAHNHSFVNFGTQTFVDLRSCYPCEGGIVVKVYPKTEGYNSPAAAEYVYEKASLATPENIKLNNTVLTWSAVDGADKYEVTVNGTAYETETASFDLASLLNYVEGTAYEITVRAVGDSTSAYTDAVTALYYEMGDVLTYSKSTLTWAPVVGAEKYEIQVNDGEIVTVEGGLNSALITLTKAGANTVKVRFADGSVRSDWVQTTVYAHKVTFDTLGGSHVEVQYKAVGDLMDIPDPEKTGYKFVDWYNVPGGAASNGMAYTDELFAESGALVLYAYYEANKYEIIYNYGTGGSASETTGEVSYEKNYQLTVPTATDVAGAFGGWFSAPYGMGTQYTDENGKSLAPWTSLEGKELYAFWIDKALEFTLTKVNGVDVYSVMKGERIDLVNEITVPATFKGVPVAMVAGNAFKNCTSLKVINLPETVLQISIISPFDGCTSLEAVNVYEVEGSTDAKFWSLDGVLFENGENGAASKLVLMPLAKTGTYRIPAGITEIPEGAFKNSAITKVVIPASVTTIGREAFAGCTKLTSVIFETAALGETEENLMIGARAFRGCTSLEKINLPARLTEIKLQKYIVNGSDVSVDKADNAFLGCTSLVSVTVASANASYKSVDGVLYSKDGKTLVYCPATAEGAFEIPAGVQQIAPGAFIGCSAITEITVPSSVVLIGECAFYGLTDLTKVTFKGVALNDLTLDKYAFRDCAELSEIVLEEGSRLAVISEGAFRGCSAIESFTIPATVTAVKAEAFRDCTDLETINFAANGKTLAFGENAFYNCSALYEVNLPANVSEIPGVFSGCTSLRAVNVDSANPYFTSEDGVVFNVDKTEILFFPIGKTGDYALPTTVTKIANGVFSGVELGTLTIGNAITVIGEDAFRNASLDEIVFEGECAASLTIENSAFYNTEIYYDLVLPAHTKTIENYAFCGADLDLVVNEGVTSFGDYAFYDADVSVNVPASVKTIGAYCFAADYYYADVTFDENSTLEVIGEYAFSENGIESVSFPATLTTIGAFAFYNCEDLSSVSFADNGSLKTIGAYAFSASSSWYCNSITEITIPNTVTDIGAYAFANTALETVIFAPGGTEDLILGTTYIENYIDYNGIAQTNVLKGNVFADTDDLETVVLPARLVEIRQECFKYAGYYTTLSVTFEEGVDSRLATIGYRAFYSSKLGSFVIPKSVRNLAPAVDTVTGELYDRMGVGESAFDGCYSKLTSVTFEMGGTDPLTIGYSAFEGCERISTMVLPARLASYTDKDGNVIPALANGAEVFADCDGITAFDVEDAQGAGFAALNGALFTADMKELVCYPIASSQTTFEIPATVTKIGDYAFYGASTLTAITFAENAAPTSVGEYAFADCRGLTALTLPDTITTIGNAAFYSCRALETLTLPAGLEGFNGGMIEYCYALKEFKVGANGAGTNFSAENGVLYNADKTALVLYPVAKEDTEFTLPTTVKVIENRAFSGNTILTKLVLNEGLVEIRSYAFSSTYLTEINIPSTVQLIDNNAFRSASYLNSITFADNGEEPLVIGDYAFYYTSSLKNIALPARLAIINNNVFNNSGLTAVEFADNSNLASVGNYAFAYTDIVDIELPAGVEKLGKGVFLEVVTLKKAVFNEGLVETGASIFGGCEELTTVYFPASLKTLGANTFFYHDSYDPFYCTKLETVVFAEGSMLESIPAGTFAYTAIKSFVVPAGVKEIEGASIESKREQNPGAFEGCAELELVSFADGTVCSAIGNYAFSNATALKFITIPTSVSTLGQSAFNNCASLTSITVPETVTNFGEYTFNSCDELSSVVLATKATELSDYMFAHCSKLTEIVIPETVTTIGTSCFSATGLTEVTVPAGVSSLGTYGAFSRNEKLEKVVFLGESLTLIPRTTFEGCYLLSDVTLPSSVETIEEEAFENCESLTEITLPKALAALDTTAFFGTGISEFALEEGNTALAVKDGVLYNADMTAFVCYPPCKTDTTFTVPATVEIITEGVLGDYIEVLLFEAGGMNSLVIDEQGLAGMNLTKVVLPERISKIGDEAFYGCSNLLNINVPSGLKENDFGEDAFYGCTKLIEIRNNSDIELVPGDEKCGGIAAYAVRIYTEGDSTANLDENGFLTIGVDSDVYLISYSGTETEITIPEGVTVISAYAFEESSITSVTFSSTVKKVNEGAFAYADLESVTLNEGLTELGVAAFYYCRSITEINLPSTLKVIDDQAFYYCRGISDITLPASLEKIGEQAFYYCSDITSVNMPESIKYIGEYAFYSASLDCDIVLGANLETVGYGAFYYCDNINFFVKASSCPEGWDEEWNVASYSGNHSVIWGYTGEDITYDFVVGEDAPAVESITSDMPIDMPVATKEGFYFGGWYDSADYSGNKAGDGYYSSEKTTLYAKWLTEEEYNALFAGTSFDYAIDVTLGESYDVIIDTEGESVFLKFTADEAVKYHVYLSGGYAYADIYKEGEFDGYSWDYLYGYDGIDEDFYYTCEAGVTYYIEIYLSSWADETTGEFEFILTKSGS